MHMCVKVHIHMHTCAVVARYQSGVSEIFNALLIYLFFETCFLTESEAHLSGRLPGLCAPTTSQSLSAQHYNYRCMCCTHLFIHSASNTNSGLYAYVV